MRVNMWRSRVLLSWNAPRHPLTNVITRTLSALAASGLLASTVRAASGAGRTSAAAVALGSGSCDESSDAARRMSMGGLPHRVDGLVSGPRSDAVKFRTAQDSTARTARKSMARRITEGLRWQSFALCKLSRKGGQAL